MSRRINVAIIIALALASYGLLVENPIVFSLPGQSQGSSQDEVATAYENHQSDVQVRGRGKVERILRDDTSGSRHQKFILRVSSVQTVLISHNIDLAPRITNLSVGDEVAFFGEYEWSEQGGVVHWTHHDPAGRHPGGWLKHDGRTYQCRLKNWRLQRS